MFDERVDEVLGVVGRLFVLAIASVAMLFLCGIALKPLLPLGLPMGDAGRILYAMMLGISLLVGHVVVVMSMERSRWSLAGLGADAWRPFPLLASLAIGALVIALPGAALLLAKRVQLEPAVAGSWGWFALTALLSVSVFALVEELIFRGYLLGLLADRWGAAVAIGITTVGFVFAHQIGTRSTPAALVSIAVAGVLFGLLRLRTKSLAAVWIAHVALNWTQVAVFHAPVPWLELSGAPGYRMLASGAAWLTGGSLGLESGAAVAVTLLLATLIVHKVWPPAVRKTSR